MKQKRNLESNAKEKWKSKIKEIHIKWKKNNDWNSPVNDRKLRWAKRRKIWSVRKEIILKNIRSKKIKWMKWLKIIMNEWVHEKKSLRTGWYTVEERIKKKEERKSRKS